MYKVQAAQDIGLQIKRHRYMRKILVIQSLQLVKITDQEYIVLGVGSTKQRFLARSRSTGTLIALMEYQENKGGSLEWACLSWEGQNFVELRNVVRLNAFYVKGVALSSGVQYLFRVDSFRHTAETFNQLRSRGYNRYCIQKALQLLQFFANPAEGLYLSVIAHSLQILFSKLSSM